MQRTFAVIPAAGKSRRMGRPKLSLPLGDRTVLESVVEAVTLGGVEKVVVVIAPGDTQLRALAEKTGAAVLELSSDTPAMRDTVEYGLAWLEKQFQPSSDDGWLLLPADHPCIDEHVVRQLLEARAAAPDQSVVVPTFEGRRGHPVWIAWNLVANVRSLPRHLGLNALLRQHGAETLEVPVATKSVLWDLDTPDDYQELCRR